MKVTFECETDMKPGERIQSVELIVCRVGVADPEQELFFSFSRPQRVREGKHLRLSNSGGMVVKVGELEPHEIQERSKERKDSES